MGFLEIVSALAMLTQDQEKWVNHLSNDSKIKIVPFDPTAQEKFEKIKIAIHSKLGESVTVEHHGATSLGISGQDEIDIYVPVLAHHFDEILERLKGLFGEPRSNYALERARFVTSEAGKHIDVFVVNQEHHSWLDALKFENYLRVHPKALEEYRKLKESGHGLSTREYYRRKIEFINSILGKI